MRSMSVLYHSSALIRAVAVGFTVSYTDSVRRRRKNIDLSSKSNPLRRRRKNTESRRTFNKNSCDLLTAITHTEILVAI